MTECLDQRHYSGDPGFKCMRADHRETTTLGGNRLKVLNSAPEECGGTLGLVRHMRSGVEPGDRVLHKQEAQWQDAQWQDAKPKANATSRSTVRSPPLFVINGRTSLKDM